MIRQERPTTILRIVGPLVLFAAMGLVGYRAGQALQGQPLHALGGLAAVAVIGSTAWAWWR